MHRIEFFALDVLQVAQIPEEPTLAETFIHAVGRELGTIVFPPGAAMLFFLAAGEITGQELLPLLTGPICETNPRAELLLGGLDRPVVERASQALDMFLSEAFPDTAGLADLAERVEVSTTQLWAWLSELCLLFKKSLTEDFFLVTLYR